jgi:hypothetical protein
MGGLWITDPGMIIAIAATAFAIFAWAHTAVASQVRLSAIAPVIEELVQAVAIAEQRQNRRRSARLRAVKLATRSRTPLRLVSNREGRSSLRLVA